MLEEGAKKWRRHGVGSADASASAGATAPAAWKARGVFQLGKAGRRESAVPLRDDISEASYLGPMHALGAGAAHVSISLLLGHLLRGMHGHPC
jgi:hypothetical protein